MGWVPFLCTAALVLEPMTVYEDEEIDLLLVEGFSMSN
jgi:hypothetical protein